MSECLSNSIYMYIVVMVSLYISKPSFLFYHEEEKCLFKSFGCGKNKSVLSIHILSIILSIFIYFLTFIIIKIE